MPGYVSHTIMAKDVYQKLKNKNCDLLYLQTYSLGGDLCKYAKCRYASHHKDMDKFIYNMADYLKDNNLTNNKELLGVLYGHICHYIMDNTIHPLVRIIDKTCQKNKNNHTMLELYYDAYLSKNICNKRIDKYNREKILSAKTNKEINKMLDYVYDKTYATKHVSWYYLFNLGLYRIIKYLYYIFGYNLLKKLSGINKFLLTNKDIDLLNNEHLISYQNYQKKECHDDLLNTYNISITRAIKYIDDINKYLNI